LLLDVAAVVDVAIDDGASIWRRPSIPQIGQGNDHAGEIAVAKSS
jgi:hypothetical protein